MQNVVRLEKSEFINHLFKMSAKEVNEYPLRIIVYGFAYQTLQVKWGIVPYDSLHVSDGARWGG